MKNVGLIMVWLLIFSFGCNTKENQNDRKIQEEMLKKYPNTFRDDTVADNYFGTVVKDPYRWLEDDNSDSTAAWVDRQIAYTNKYLQHIPFRDSVKSRLKELVNYEKFGTPFMKKGKYYMFKNSGLQNQNVLYQVDEKGNNIKEILNPNNLSTDGTKALSGISFNKEGNLLGYMISESGADWKTGFVLDLETGKLLKDEIKWIKFSGMSWFGDGFFYSRYPKSKDGKLSTENKNHKLYYHKLGTSQSEDKVWFEDLKNPNRNIYASTSDDEKFLFLNQVESTTGNAFSFVNLSKGKTSEIKVVNDFTSDINFIDNIGDKFILLTDRNAPNKKIVLVDSRKPNEKNWKTIVPESDNPIKGVSVINKNLYVSYLENAYSKVKIYDLKGKFIKDFDLPAIGSISGFSSEKGNDKAFFTFSSFLFPGTIYEFDVNTFKVKKFISPKIDFNVDDYKMEQVWFSSKDGTKVPMFLTYKKSLKMTGKNPVLLYGYGGFNIPLTPSFRSSRLWLLENGGVLAIANLRGGGEFGEKWHKNGTLDKKQNVFDDFIAAAEYLIKNKYTSPEYIAIEGGSNGGLLIGACMLQRPDLFGVAFPKVGVLDMLRYHKFTIGWAWATDYGKSDDKDAFNYLIKYSPVHNVKKVEYPATLVFTADHDDRVVPAHSFKFISELQHKQVGKKPVLIRIDKKAGHGAGKPLTKILDELADMYSFMFYNMGLSYKKNK